MQDVNWTALIIFVLLFAFITWLGFAAAHWRKGDLDLLHEWGLGGRRFGTVITWFLIGGDLYTAYTFIAVPALAFGAGAVAFFAVPYTIMIYPILFLVFPRLWHVCHKHNYITPADFVRGRFGNRWLALAVTITGIVATMPYIALQLVGLQVVIGGLGVSGTGYARRPAAGHRLHHSGGLHVFQRLARAGLDRRRQGHPDLHHRVRRRHRRSDRSWAASARSSLPCRRQKLLLAAPPANSTGAYGVYATLALGSALALFLYPHSVTGILSASSGHAIRRNAATAAGLFVHARAAGAGRLLRHRRRRRKPSRIRRRLQTIRQQFRGAGAVPAQLPVLVRRHRLCRDRHRRAGAGGDHVDRRGESLHPQHPSRVHQPESDRQAGSADGEMGVAGGQVRRADLHHLRAARNTRSICSSSAAS